MNERLNSINGAMGVDARVAHIDAARGIGGPMGKFAHDRAYRSVALEKWATFIYSVAYLTVIPVVPVVLLNQELGPELLGGTAVVGAISLICREFAIHAVQEETLNHQKITLKKQARANNRYLSTRAHSQLGLIAHERGLNVQRSIRVHPVHMESRRYSKLLQIAKKTV